MVMSIWQFHYHDNDVAVQQILLYANNVLFFFFDLTLKYDMFLWDQSQNTVFCLRLKYMFMCIKSKMNNNLLFLFSNSSRLDAKDLLSIALAYSALGLRTRISACVWMEVLIFCFWLGFCLFALNKDSPGRNIS